MKTFYIPVHYHEREFDTDSLVMLITPEDIGADELDELLSESVRRHKARLYPTQDDMIDAVFASVAKETGAVWSYCETQSSLCFEDFDEGAEDSEKREVDAAGLAALLVKLRKGETLDFTLAPVDPEEDTPEEFGATLVYEFGSYVILINRYDGGSPCAIDVTTYYTDLKKIKEALFEYFLFKDSPIYTVSVDERHAQKLEAR